MIDFEILEKFIKDYKLESDFENLNEFEQCLYKCQLRDTLIFNLYLLKYRIKELFNKAIKELINDNRK